jgi:uncharacterized protein (TIGR03643 family)
LSLQYKTLSQSRSHFFRQVNGRLQALQILLGRCSFLTVLFFAFRMTFRTNSGQFCFSHMANAEIIKAVLSNPVSQDRVIEMAWEDRTPFEAIEFQFGLAEADVIEIMRRSLKRSSFNLWRKRVNSGVSIKHQKIRDASIIRFKCSRQRQISLNKISKR